ncbi:unnamed protein product [Haemonchus placei]|uniref:Carn_acyltransf domain-containing protein n=1 Tax=Haemonchus placei TaxID=6290 RepID=A0A0N4WTA5_HAEPC|nr:unnamed protein product [Haemonchus placei]
MVLFLGKIRKTLDVLCSPDSDESLRKCKMQWLMELITFAQVCETMFCNWYLTGRWQVAHHRTCMVRGSNPGPKLFRIQIATDECDFGMGLELGQWLFLANHEPLDKFAHRLLAIAYSMLGRQEYKKIVDLQMAPGIRRRSELDARKKNPV